MHPRVEEGARLTSQAEFDLTKPQTDGQIVYHHRAVVPGEPLPYKESLATLKIIISCITESGFIAIKDVGLQAVYDDPVNGRLRKFGSCEEAEKHGVMLLHILSELQGE